MLKHWARADAASVPGSAQLRPVASDQYALRHATAPGATTIGVEATRLWLWYSWPNGSDQWLAAHGQPSPTTMPASPFASRGSGRPIQMDWTDHSVGGNSTGASGPHATAASPLLEATRPIDEGDD
jgi:hypothetical protein